MWDAAVEACLDESALGTDNAEDYGSGVLASELKEYINEEVFRLCEIDGEDLIHGHDFSARGSLQSDDTGLNFDSWLFDTTDTDTLLASQGDFSDLFAMPSFEHEKNAASTKVTRKKAPKSTAGPKVAQAEKKSIRSTSEYRGVTHHCRTGRYEAHIWESGKQVYLGGFDREAQAAIAYDLCALKCRGTQATTNFHMANYRQELEKLDSISKEELILSLRRQSKGFGKGSSKFRGVTKHAKGKFEARIGQLVGKKYRYLGLWPTEIEAAVAYDVESVRQKGMDALTNFDISSYTSVLAEHYDAQAKALGKRKHWSDDDARQNGVVVEDAKTSERNFRAQLASKHAEFVASARTAAAGPACECDPSEVAIATVRSFFDSEAKICSKKSPRSATSDNEDDDACADAAIEELQNIVREARAKTRVRKEDNRRDHRRR